jgi:hypothetical protein
MLVHSLRLSVTHSLIVLIPVSTLGFFTPRTSSPRQRQHQRAERAEDRGDEEHSEIAGVDGVLGEYLVDVHLTASL